MNNLRGINIKNQIWRPACFDQSEWVEWKRHDVMYKMSVGATKSRTSVCSDCTLGFSLAMDAVGLCDYYAGFRRYAVEAQRAKNLK